MDGYELDITGEQKGEKYQLHTARGGRQAGIAYSLVKNAERPVDEVIRDQTQCFEPLRLQPIIVLHGVLSHSIFSNGGTSFPRSNIWKEYLGDSCLYRLEAG